MLFVLGRRVCLPCTRLDSTTAPFAGSIGRGNETIRRQGRQTVHLSPQESRVAMEADWTSRRPATGIQVPRLRPGALGSRLGIADPVGGLGEGRAAFRRVQPEHELDVMAAIEPLAFDPLAITP